MDNLPQNPNQPEQYQAPPLESTPTGLNQPNHSSKKLLVSILILVALIGGYFALAKYQSWWPFRDVAVSTPTPTPNENADWKTYRNDLYEFKYSGKLKLSEENGKVTLSHSIPYENSGECDMTGDNKTYSTLTDFKLSFEKVTGNLKFEYTDGEYSLGGLKGPWQYTGAEGCGEYIYHFSIADITLVVKRDAIQATSRLSTAWDLDKILKVPGVISKEESQRLFDQIFSTLKFTR